MMKEEQILFPMIKQGITPLTGPDAAMESEHDEAGAGGDVIKHVTQKCNAAARSVKLHRKRCITALMR